MKLKRLKINSYRNVRPCDLKFCDGVNILLGPNGAGKTTLLNFISRILRSGLLDPSDPFSIELELELPRGSLSGTIAQAEREPVSQEISFLESTAGAIGAASQKLHALQLNLTVRIDESTSVSIRSEGEKFYISKDADNQWELPRRILAGNTISALLANTQQFLMGPVKLINLPILSNLWRFDEGLDTFRGITARSGSDGLVNSEIRPILKKLRFGNQAPFFGTGMIAGSLQARMQSRSQDDAMEVTFQHEELKFLADVVRLLKFRSAEAKIELIERHVVDNSRSTETHFGNLRIWFTRQDGSIVRDEHLSYGQKRLFSFLYYLDANPSFVIADELVNGMHHVWIEECMNAIGDRQAFLTSQNPLLLDYLSFESVEQVRDSIIQCRTEVVDGKEDMVWRNLTDDEADMFFSAYRVGIEHVGEILRTRGLW